MVTVWHVSWATATDQEWLYDTGRKKAQAEAAKGGKLQVLQNVCDDDSGCAGMAFQSAAQCDRWCCRLEGE